MSKEDAAGGPEGPEQDGETASGERSPRPDVSPPEGDAPAAAVEPPSVGSGAAVDAYQQRARLAEDRLAEVLAAYRSLKHETEAHRDRITRNLERRYDQRRERLLVKFIEILDNLDRALEAAEATAAGMPLIEGLILVRTQLLQTLQEEGLERIPVLGLPYDPHVSEAVETHPVDNAEHHHVVVKEMLRGYRLNGRIARASRVVVGEYSAPAAPSAPPAEAAAGTAPEEGPSLEEIIARTEAQEALFPSAFEEPSRDEDADED